MTAAKPSTASRAATIHVAYCVGRRGGTSYRAVAVVTNDGCEGYHTRRVCTDDTADLAVEGAIKYVRDTFRREGLADPVNVVHHGKRPAIDIEHVLFVRSLPRG